METTALVPSTRDLYFILHDILCYDYKLIPKLYDKENRNQCGHLSSNDNIHKVLFELSSMYFDETERNLLNISTLIKAGINNNKSLNSLIVLDDIIHLIAEYSNYTPFQFDKSVLDLEYKQQFTFNDKLNTAIFDKPWNDYINLINDENLLMFDCNGNIRFDTFIFDQGDEMWVGIINKSIYEAVTRLEDEIESLFYYDSKYRLGLSQIHAFGDRPYRLLDEQAEYGQYDWISFCINTEKNKITFYKNQKEIAQINPLINGDHWVYCAVVDAKDDGFFVEKVLSLM